MRATSTAIESPSSSELCSPRCVITRTIAPYTGKFSMILRCARVANSASLENVIERGVLLSTSGVFDIDQALPQVAEKFAVADAQAPDNDRVLSMAELAKLERKNIQRALAQAGGKVSGPNGAAKRLGINPSTLSSRLRALGLRKSAESRARLNTSSTLLTSRGLP